MNRTTIWQAIAVVALLTAGVEGYLLYYRQTPAQHEEASRKFRKECVDRLASANLPTTVLVDSCSCGQAKFDDTGSVSEGMKAAVACINPDKFTE
jgi:hypothetical protein